MPFSQKNRLPCRNQSGYISAAPHKTGAGILNPIQSKAHNRASVFFCAYRIATSFSRQNYGGAYGADFGRAGFFALRC
ncbi:Ash protein family protein [Citrobacter koseri]|uniref:Ash protein family protein n=1 Tax=Citrobacter koseri TaxID=545 RepID=A0A078LPU8_CITKO|nr:Ash protein family protein [Citrobacter koseri]